MLLEVAPLVVDEVLPDALRPAFWLEDVEVESLLATAELLVEPVEPDALPLLAKPLVLPVCDEEALDVEDGEALLVLSEL